MHETLEKLHGKLTELESQVNTIGSAEQPFNMAHGNWTFPALTREDLAQEARSLIELIEKNSTDELGDHGDELQDYVRRIEFLRGSTVPNLWGNPGAGVPAYLFTLERLRKVLTAALVHDDHEEALVKLRKLTAQVRTMEARLKDLEPRTTDLASMLSRIESAHDAADQLPTDLESLAEARRKLEKLIETASQDQVAIEDIRRRTGVSDKQIQQSAANAESVLERCETAYSAATSVGLAAAFAERSTTLSKSMWIWVGGLVVALGAGSYFGSSQLKTLSELFTQPHVGTSVVLLNLLLALLSVGAPVWFGWLATKQVGQRFRLAEDYAFKASISRAYEGFRREAARVDKDMEARLLASALARFDELPLRLVEADSHGSPWHELASSDLVKDAMRAVPTFAGQVKELAARALQSATPAKAKAPEAPAGGEAS